jgi:Glycosyl hydrolase family 53
MPIADPHAITRRAVIVRAAGAALAVPARWPAAALARGAGPSGCTFRNSLSVSPFTETVLRQTALRDGARTARTVREVQELFVRRGSTELYQRVATRRHAPMNGQAEHGFARAIERARLARALRLPFNPELGLFRSYGDAGNYQEPPDFIDYHAIRLPGPWLTLRIEQMERALRQYGELVGRQILGTGVRVNVWDIGNEVEFGIAGVALKPLLGTSERYVAPDAVDPAIGQMSVASLVGLSEAERITWLRRHLWPYIGRLLAATAEGIRRVDRNARFSTHISGIFQPTPATALAFWETVQAAGYRPAVFGASYYPTAGALAAPGNLLTLFERIASALGQRFNRQTFIAEGAYPSGHMFGSFPYNTPVPGYPQTTSGQERFISDLVRWGIRSGHLAGFRPWAPDYCTTDWQPMSWFNAPGPNRIATAKPALDAVAGVLNDSRGSRSSGGCPRAPGRLRRAVGEGQ